MRVVKDEHAPPPERGGADNPNIICRYSQVPHVSVVINHLTAKVKRSARPEPERHVLEA